MAQNGIVQRSQFFDGVGIDPSDFNSLSVGARSYLNDMVLGTRMRVAQNSVSGIAAYTTPALFAFGHGAAPRHGGTARSYTCNAGLLFFTPLSGTIDGASVQIRSYYVNQGEINGTFAAADPTNGRLDAVFVRITDVDGPQVTRDFKDATGAVTSQPVLTTKQAKLEWTVVTGTPSAKPQVPSPPDSTWACWAIWYLPATFNTTFSGPKVLFDYRIPCDGFKRHFVPGQMAAAGDSNWTRNSGDIGVHNASTAVVSLDFTCPVRSGRLMAAGMSFNSNALGGHANLQVRTFTPSQTLSPPAGGSGEPANGMTGYNGYTLNKGLWVDTSRIFAGQSTDGYALLPVWANGYGCESEDVSQGGGDVQDGQVTYDSRILTLRYTTAATNEFLVGATFDVAG